MATTVASVVLEQAASAARERADAVRAELNEKREEYRRSVQPLEDELAALEDAIQRITGEGTTRRPGRPRTSTSTPRDDNGPTPSGRAPRGQNTDAILRVLGERPGVSAAEVAAATGITKPTVASALSKLAKDGRVQRADLGGNRVGWSLPR